MKKIFTILSVAILIVLLSTTALAEGTTNGASMHELASDYYEIVEDGITDSYGNSYTSNVVKLDASKNAYVTYDLDGNYTDFSGAFVASQDTGSGAQINVAIFADGEEVYSLTNYTRQMQKQTFNIDLTGVKQLDIKTSNDGDYSYGWLFMVESTFTKADSQAATVDWSSLRDCVVIDSSYYEGQVALKKDSFGNLHDGAIRLDASNNAYVLYNLNKQYVTFTGAFVAGEDTGSGGVLNVEIYCDDKLVYSKSGITKQTAQLDFSIDVSNVDVLKITTSNDGEYSYGYVYLVDDILLTHQHNLGDWAVETEATCTEEGAQSRYCTECGELVETETLPATGHTADGNWVVLAESTCNEEGKQVQYCSVCGEIAVSEEITVLDHTSSGEWVITQEATCTTEGKQVQYCSVCGAVASTETISTTEHDYGDWTTISGSIWSNPIVKERTCSICGNVETVERNPTSWLKPLIIVLFIIIFGGLAVIIVTLKMNGLALEPASIKKLFSKESLTDEDIENILNKSDDDS